MTADVARSSERFQPPVLLGRRLRLVPFQSAHVTPQYLTWLSDRTVNRFSRRLGRPPETAASVAAWLSGLAADEVVYAMEEAGLGHIGNVKYGPINWSNLACDVSIMVGAVESWGRGYGAEAVYLVSRHLFEDRGVNRLSAASINPGFIRMVEKLGWVREGVQREEARVGGAFHDSVLLSQLRREFRRRRDFEGAET